jgi:AcrR family transcriptional regulator
MPKPAPSRRDAEKARSRSLIIDAATRLFAERGLETVTFGDIAKAAGISRPLIYFHFKDRDELFLETVLRSHQMLHTQFVAAIAQQTDPVGQAEAIGRAYERFFAENRREFVLMSCFEASAGKRRARGPLEEQIQFHGQAMIQLIVSVIARGRKEGTMRRDLGDPLRVALCLQAFTHGLLQMCASAGTHLREEHGVEPAELVDQGFALMRAALRSE